MTARYVCITCGLRPGLASDPGNVTSFLNQEWLPSFDDSGRNAKMRWGPHPASRPFRWMHECRAHIGCTRVLLTTVVDGALLIRAKGEHTTEIRVLKRSNDTLTWCAKPVHTIHNPSEPYKPVNVRELLKPLHGPKTSGTKRIVRIRSFTNTKAPRRMRCSRSKEWLSHRREPPLF